MSWTRSVESLESRIDVPSVVNPPAKLTDDPDTLLAEMLGAPSAESMSPADTLRLLRLLRLALLVPAIQALAGVAGLADGPIPILRDRFVAILDRSIDALRERIEVIVQSDITARRIWELIDLLCANIRGLLVSGLQGHDDFSSLDEWSYVDWLRMNRVSSRTLRSPIVRGAHDLGFAYRDGNARAPQIAAGQAINAGCRFFFTYKGALFWRMKAGMGDVLFAPMYLALRSRGVKFRFFHRLDEIVLGPDRKTVTGLRFWRQARLKRNGPNVPTNYRPLVLTRGRHPMPVWRDTVDMSQFDYDAATRDKYADALAHDESKPAALDFDSTWGDGLHGERVSATVGGGAPGPSSIGQFDSVVVTIPVAGLRRVLATACRGADRCGPTVERHARQDRHRRNAVRAALGHQADARARLAARPGELLGVRAPVRHLGRPFATSRGRTAASSRGRALLLQRPARGPAAAVPPRQ